MKHLVSLLLMTLLLTVNSFAEKTPTFNDLVNRFLKENSVGKTLLSLEEAMKSIQDAEIDKIEIDPDDVKDFIPFQGGDFEYKGFRMIVLEREASLKEFTKVDAFFPMTLKSHFLMTLKARILGNRMYG